MTWNSSRRVNMAGGSELDVIAECYTDQNSDGNRCLFINRLIILNTELVFTSGGYISISSTKQVCCGEATPPTSLGYVRLPLHC